MVADVMPQTRSTTSLVWLTIWTSGRWSKSWGCRWIGFGERFAHESVPRDGWRITGGDSSTVSPPRYYSVIMVIITDLFANDFGHITSAMVEVVR